MIGVAACVSGPTKVDLFWLDVDSKIAHKSGDGTQWSVSLDDLGGAFITIPAAVATNSAQLGFPQLLDVFAVGPDFAMYAKQFAQGAWAADWLNLEGDFSSGPGAIGRANGRLDIFAVGSDYAMYHRFRAGTPNNQRWSPAWEYLGGRFSSTASVISRDLTSIDVFARGADFTLRHRRNVNNVWSEHWQNLGGSLASPPVAVSWGPQRIDVFAVGTDGALWHRWWDGEIWNDWESLGGALTQTPSVTTWGPGRLDVFGLGLDGAFHHFRFDNQAWSGREPLSGDFGGRFASGPTAVSPSQNRINVVGPGTDGAIWGKVWNGANWSPVNFDQVGFGLMLPTRYRFSADHVHVTTTRALDEDTDAAAAAIGAGNWPIQTVTQRIGGIGGLTSPDSAQLNRLHFDPVTVELCEASLFHYMITNNGHADSKVLDTALVQAAGSITSAGVEAVSKGLATGIGAILAIEVIGTTILMPVIGSLLGSLVDYVLDWLGGVVFADCDGLVAAESIAFSGRDLYLKTRDAPLSVTTIHKGTDSPATCGDNSVYEVTWTIRQV
jgi:Repeat of unknown function (DUF346)